MLKSGVATTKSKGIKTYIEGLKKGELNFYSIPEEHRNNLLIVRTERKLGIRRPIKKGFDIIQNNFFVEEDIVVSCNRNNQKISKSPIKSYFIDFESYYRFLFGDIYENACYYQYNFTEEEINKYDIDISKLNFCSLIQSTENDFSADFSEEELLKYKEVEKEKKNRKRWIKKFNDCNNYQEFVKIVSAVNKSKYRNELGFFLYSFISSSNQHVFEFMMKYISEGHWTYGIEMALCLDYDPKKVLSSFQCQGGHQRTREQRAKLEEFVSMLDLKKIECFSRSYFNEQNHFYYYQISGYIGNNKFPPVFTCYKIFDNFQSLAKYLNGNILYCDLSKAILKNTDFSQYVIGEGTKLPLQYYSDLTYSCEKRYDRLKKLFRVDQFWKNDQGKIIKMYSHEFEYFFDFIYFCKNDLSNADLLFCDGLLNLKDFSQINFNNSKLKSEILDRLSAPYLMSEYYDAITQSFPFSLVNEEKSQEELMNFRKSYDFESGTKNKKIFYVTDLHLIHRIQNAACKSDLDIIYVLQIIIDNLLRDIRYPNNILLLGGDISSDFSLYCLFVKLLKKSIDEFCYDVKVFFILGNHELWAFQDCSLDSIVQEYKTILTANNMFLLQNNILYVGDDDEVRSIETEDILRNQKSEIRERLIRARIILFGGLAFSGYCEEFNANNCIYLNVIDRQEEIKQTKNFEILYNIICDYLADRKVIILTHMPFQNWSEKASFSKGSFSKGFVYVSGHTHRNYFYDDGECRIYADNQIGYSSRCIAAKYFYIDYDYDTFSEYPDGIYEINREQYIDFFRGKNIQMSFNREFYKLYMLKKHGYYCFIIQSQNENLYILNGGSLKKLKSCNIHYYYGNMEKVTEKISDSLKEYFNFQKKIAKEIKMIGGEGYIHGCIVDIDFYNHIYINPFDLSITPYWAKNMVYKQIYTSIPKLLKAKCTGLYTNYIKLLKDKNEAGLMIRNSLNNKSDSQFYLDTDIYKASRLIKSVQKLSHNILSVWIDSSTQLLDGDKE